MKEGPHTLSSVFNLMRQENSKSYFRFNIPMEDGIDDVLEEFKNMIRSNLMRWYFSVTGIFCDQDPTPIFILITDQKIISLEKIFCSSFGIYIQCKKSSPTKWEVNGFTVDESSISIDGMTRYFMFLSLIAVIKCSLIQCGYEVNLSTPENIDSREWKSMVQKELSKDSFLISNVRCHKDLINRKGMSTMNNKIPWMQILFQPHILIEDFIRSNLSRWIEGSAFEVNYSVYSRIFSSTNPLNVNTMDVILCCENIFSISLFQTDIIDANGNTGKGLLLSMKDQVSEDSYIRQVMKEAFDIKTKLMFMCMQLMLHLILHMYSFPREKIYVNKLVTTIVGSEDLQLMASRVEELSRGNSLDDLDNNPLNHHSISRFCSRVMYILTQGKQ